MNIKTKSDAEVLLDIPRVMAALLSRLQRDLFGLRDYPTPEELDEQLRRIRDAIRCKLHIDECWPLDSAKAVSETYESILRQHLKSPAHFDPRLRASSAAGQLPQKGNAA
jgi:hypothetical protein